MSTIFNLEQLVRKNIQLLAPYKSARDDFKGKEGVFLDANENPFGNLNRYPDPYQTALKQALSSIHQIPTQQIFIGNGSDEVIDIAVRTFCNPGKDAIIQCSPTYGIYEVVANVNDVQVIDIPLNADFQLDVEKILAQEAKILFLCSPNNPTGNSLDDIELILQQFKGIVFVDEAYIDFSSRPSYKRLIDTYPNLIVSQTLSKAWGLAAIRVGIAFASEAVIHYYNKVKPPYNVSLLNQEAALAALNNKDLFETQLATILAQRAWLIEALNNLPIVLKTYATDANFVLAAVTDANFIYQSLIDQKIITRNRHSVVNNAIRITVGTAAENQALITAMEQLAANVATT